MVAQLRIAELALTLDDIVFVGFGQVLQTTGAEKNRIYFYFGLMNERMSRFEEAVENYQRAINFSLNDEEVEQYNKAIARCLTKQKSYNI